MRKMKKVFAVVCAAVLALSITGCNKSGGKTVDKQAVETAKQYITLGQYKGIQLTKKSTEITDKDIEDGIALIQSQNAYYQPASEDDTISNYDIVNIDLTAEIDGEKNDGFTVSSYDVYIGMGSYVMSGFGENLIGMKKGTNKITMIIPSNFTEASLVGKEVEFTVIINSITKFTIPEFDDKLVQSISEYKTAEEYKEVLKKQFASEKEEKVKSEYKLEAWKKVVDATECSGYPEEKVEEKKAEYEEQFKIYANINNTTVDNIIKQNYGMSLEDYAKESIKQSMIFDLIADTENISISEKEYSKNLQKFAKNNGYDDTSEFETKFGKEKIIETMLWDKIRQFIVDNAVFE